MGGRAAHLLGEFPGEILGRGVAQLGGDLRDALFSGGQQLLGPGDAGLGHGPAQGHAGGSLVKQAQAGAAVMEMGGDAVHGQVLVQVVLDEGGHLVGQVALDGGLQVRVLGVGPAGDGAEQLNEDLLQVAADQLLRAHGRGGVGLKLLQPQPGLLRFKGGLELFHNLMEQVGLAAVGLQDLVLEHPQVGILAGEADDEAAAVGLDGPDVVDHAGRYQGALAAMEAGLVVVAEQHHLAVGAVAKLPGVLVAVGQEGPEDSGQIVGGKNLIDAHHPGELVGLVAFFHGLPLF